MRTEGGRIGVYVHFPFCLSKCAYCDFASAPLESLGGLDGARRYLDALNIELDLRAASAEFFGATVDSIYLGGGTPTVLPAEWLGALLRRIRDRFAVTDDAEVSVEANPGTVDEAKVGALLAADVNRVSLGVQSFSDGVLSVLGRCHSAAEAQAAIRAARAAGCRNLNIDLIYGAPNQTHEEWADTVRQAVAAAPEHISAYALSVEEGTPIEAQIESGALPAPDEDASADMYSAVVEALTGAGYVHYEISNFARPGFECRHNRRYWGDDEYLGVGTSAHSYRGGMRWNNREDAVVYIEWLERGVLPVARAEVLSVKGRVGEMLILGLRRAEGVGEDEIAERCGVKPTEAFGEEIRDLCSQKLLVSEDGRLRIPRDKWFVSNEVLSYFVA